MDPDSRRGARIGDRKGGLSVDAEWKNYLQAGILRGGTLAGIRQVGAAVASRVRRRSAGRLVIPEYLGPRANGRPVPPAGETEALWPGGGRGASDRDPVRLSEEIRAWAQGYAERYRDWILGRAAGSRDPEVHWTTHQFGWLFARALTSDGESAAREAREALGAWIEKMGRRRDDPSWRSFSISERIVNWSYLLQLLGRRAWPDGAGASLDAQASHLAAHLECYADGSTNNHLINNGRALYVAGVLLGREDHRDMGRSILIEEMARQFTADGFLDEGSSHYQLIFTRAYLDALYLARAAGDSSLLEALVEPTTAALRASAHFADPAAPPAWLIPLVGDISPDPPPGLFDPSMRFWDLAREAALGRAVDFSVPWYARGSGDGAGRPGGWSCHPRSGHYRFDGPRYRLWWHARRGGLHRRHSHNDWGSFQLHLRGEPILVDPGRETYLQDGRVHDGRRTLAQNAAQIDGLEQAVVRRRDLFLPRYLADGAEVRWEEEGGGGSIAFEIQCYRRLRRPVVHTRTFTLAPAGVDITDRLDGQGRHRAIIAFHLHPEVSCRRAGERLLLGTPRGASLELRPALGGRIETKTGGDPRQPGGYSSNAYGRRIETTTVFASYVADVPRTLTHTIRMLEETECCLS
jgi:heparinase II/III-like protein